MRSARFLVLAATVLLAPGCTLRSRAVLFNPVARPDASTAPVRVYLDRDGDLYPAADADTAAVAAHAALVREQYRALQAAHDPRWAELLRSTGLADGAFAVSWTAVQDTLAARATRSAVAAAGRGPLVVLIHGYNNTQAEAESTYAAVRDTLHRYGLPRGGAGFLEVYWDGRTDMRHPVRNPSAWRHAQHNGYRVGLGLRRVLNALPPGLPVRILTHSHGAKIAAVALWNVTTSISGGDGPWRQQYDSLRRDAVRYRTPVLTDLRIGMIVPAMPGNVLGDNFASAVTPAPGGTPLARLVVGLNRKDMAVAKRLGPVHLNPARLGSTTLGALPDEFARYAGLFNEPGQPERAFCVDFTEQSADAGKHDWTRYMGRQAIGAFLALLFSDPIPPAEHRCTFTPPPASA